MAVRPSIDSDAWAAFVLCVHAVPEPGFHAHFRYRRIGFWVWRDLYAQHLFRQRPDCRCKLRDAEANVPLYGAGPRCRTGALDDRAAILFPPATPDFKTRSSARAGESFGVIARRRMESERRVERWNNASVQHGQQTFTPLQYGLKLV